ncbi:MAG: hypothetical protein ACRC7G_11530 [Beijerinckiaceae bacterium]
MSEPGNLVLELLREIRKQQDLHTSEFQAVNKRIDNLRNAINGESVLGRYAVAEVEERLEAIEKRLDGIEKRN